MKDPIYKNFGLPARGKDWIKLKGNQGWKDVDGNIWKFDKLH